MNYKVVSTPRFEKKSKKLIRKYPSLKKETLQIIYLLKSKPDLGVFIGNGAFKIGVGTRQGKYCFFSPFTTNQLKNPFQIKRLSI